MSIETACHEAFCNHAEVSSWSTSPQGLPVWGEHGRWHMDETSSVIRATLAYRDGREAHSAVQCTHQADECTSQHCACDHLGLPSVIEGVQVEYQYATFELLAGSWMVPLNPRARHDPLIGGCSIGVLGSGSAGTSGGVFYRDGSPYLLSNDHVLRGSGPSGEATISQPSEIEGAAPRIIGAYLVSAQTVDAALASIHENEPLDDESWIVGRIPNAAAIDPQPGEECRSCGRGLDYNGVAFPIAKEGEITFKDQVVQVPDGRGGFKQFKAHAYFGHGVGASLPPPWGTSAPGDSGSRVWTRDQRQAPVGLVFALQTSGEWAGSGWIAPALEIERELGGTFARPVAEEPEPAPNPELGDYSYGPSAISLTLEVLPFRPSRIEAELVPVRAYAGEHIAVQGRLVDAETGEGLVDREVVIEVGEALVITTAAGVDTEGPLETRTDTDERGEWATTIQAPGLSTRVRARFEGDGARD